MTSERSLNRRIPSYKSSPSSGILLAGCVVGGEVVMMGLEFPGIVC